MPLPATRFVTTSDGVSIAYMCVGDGPPIVFASNFGGDVHNYHVPITNVRGVTDSLVALGWQVIRHDTRGMGASDRDVADWSLEARVRDLDGVVGRLGLRRFALVAADSGCPTAITYAARHPERVSQLVLICPWATGAGWYALPAVRVTIAPPTSDAEWNVVFANVIGSVVTEFADPMRSRAVAESLQRTVTPAGLAAYHRASEVIDVRSLLPRVTAPTLVIHEPTFPFGSFDLCQEVVAGIRGARFAVVHERTMIGAAHEETVATLHHFLRSDASFEHVSEAPATRHHALTPRERQVLRLIAAGRSNKAIATSLKTSERTVARHITNLYRKIDAHSKAAATAYAIRHGLT
jgi:pimeloyl-ACP methyl ester carboxylesterase/DNA-binding CsgD family transcriptional regulator